MGAEVSFATAAGPLTVFTTRPDTLWGATFMVLAPEHPLVPALTAPSSAKEVETYLQQVRGKSDLDRTAQGRAKTGVFLGSHATNPVNGEAIPIWVADYVLMGYGTGAIMAVPAHDQRDFEFARRHGLEIRVVIQPAGRDEPLQSDTMQEAWTGEGVMSRSGSFDGTPTGQAVDRVTDWLEETYRGRSSVHYKLRDWGISRQRYWGTPIPIVHTSDGEVPVAADDLPVRLPEVRNYEPTGSGESPLAAIPEFVQVSLPGGIRGRRETDTMGTFACSSWYFLRFVSPGNDQAAFDRSEMDYWLPVDMYVGGAEHAVMHLLYARFWTKALCDLGHLPFAEPFKCLRNQGMILGQDGEKMSKSRGNVITPDEMVEAWGADALRAYEMFISDFEMSTPWNTNGLSGTFRWLRRAWEVILRPPPPEASSSRTRKQDRDLRRWTHKTLLKVASDIEGFRFNTVISSLMEFTNALHEACQEAGWKRGVRGSHRRPAPDGGARGPLYGGGTLGIEGASLLDPPTVLAPGRPPAGGRGGDHAGASGQRQGSGATEPSGRPDGSPGSGGSFEPGVGAASFERQVPQAADLCSGETGQCRGVSLCRIGRVPWWFRPSCSRCWQSRF